MLTQLDKPNPIVAKKEIMKLPMIRGWMEQLRCVFLDREDPRKSMESLKTAQELLGKGYSVTIFPEGTRNSGGELGEFKAGAIRVATPCPCTGGAGVHRRQLQADEKGQPVDPSGKGQDPHPASHLHRGDEPRGDPRPARSSCASRSETASSSCAKSSQRKTIRRTQDEMDDRIGPARFAYWCEKMIERYWEEKAGKLLLLGDILYHGPRNDLPRTTRPSG